ncbi:MAG: hypothetical protein H7Y36_00385 [Armatimonadetes bacterium]|nr:hypothetical protein [Akkermansiaceae bacterium]
MNPKSIFSITDLSRLRPLVSAETLAALAAIENDDYLPSVFVDAHGKEIGYDILSEISLHKWANETGQYVFQLGERAFIPMDVEGWDGVFERNSIEDFIGDWDPGGATIEDLLVSFEITPTLDIAKKGCPKNCRVWIRHHYAPGYFQAPRDTWAKDDDLELLEFASYADARKWVKKARYADYDHRSELEPKGWYVYGYGELAPKEYVISKSWKIPT